MQGYSVDDEKNIGWLLNERFPDYALENVATGGYGTYQSWLSARRYFETLDSPPKLVVYGFNYLHLARNVQTYAWFEAANRGAKIRHVVPHVTLDREGELVRHAVHEIDDWPLESALWLVSLLHHLSIKLTLSDREAQIVPVQRELLARFNTWTRQDESHLLVAVLYDGREIDPPNGPGKGFPPVEKLFEPLNLEWVNCTLEGTMANPELRVGGTGHPVAGVHRHWAQCLEGRIRSILAGTSPSVSKPSR